MKDNEGKRFRNIDISDLTDISNPRYIKNFYLSRGTLKGRFFETGSSFVFNGFSVSLCMRGHCSLKVSGRDYIARQGSLITLSPNQFVEVGDLSDDFGAVSIIVSLDIILEFPSPVDIDFMNDALRHPVVCFPPEKFSRLLAYYDFLEKRYSETGNVYRTEISKTLLYAMMLEVCGLFRTLDDETPAVRKPRQEQLMDDFLKLLARHYRTEHNAGFYADRLHRTPKYLSGAIRRLSGRSVTDWINSTLISEIKLLLKVTDRTVLEISEELNFSSPSVFVQFFRHHTGITPLQYRKQG